MALTILAALLGLFGPGLLSYVSAGERDGQLWVEYHRFWRLKSPLKVQIYVATEAASENVARIWISRTYLDNMSIQHVTPQPERVEAGPDRQQTLGGVVRHLVDTAFSGAADRLVLALLEGRGITSDEAERITKLIEESRQAKHKRRS